MTQDMLKVGVKALAGEDQQILGGVVGGVTVKMMDDLKISAELRPALSRPP